MSDAGGDTGTAGAGEGQGGAAIGGGQGGNGQGDQGDQGATWLEGMSADVRTALTPKNFTGVEALGSAYLDLEKKFYEGGEKLALPGEDAKPEDWDPIYDKLGRPEAADKYDLGDFAPPEGLPWNAEVQNGVLEAAHAAGLNSRQVQTVMKAYGEKQGAAFKAYNDAAAVNAETMTAELKKDWGEAYDAKMDLAKQAVDKIYGADDGDAATRIRLADGSYLLDNPLITRGLAELGEKWAEEGALPGGAGGRNFSMTPAEAAAKIETIKADEEWVGRLLDSNKPGHAQALQELQRLQQITGSGRQAAGGAR